MEVVSLENRRRVQYGHVRPGRLADPGIRPKHVPLQEKAVPDPKHGRGGDHENRRRREDAAKREFAFQHPGKQHSHTATERIKQIRNADRR